MEKLQAYTKFAKSIFAVGFLDFMGVVSGLVFLSLITKMLGAQDYGIWIQIRVLMSLAVALTFLGLQEALIRFIPGGKNQEEIREGVYSSLFLIFFLNAVIGLLLLVFTGRISAFLHVDQLFVRLLSLIIILESLSTFFLVVIRAIKEIRNYFWIMTLKLFGEIVLVVSVVLLGQGLLGAIVSMLIIRILIFSILILYVIKKIGFAYPSFSLTKKYLSFSLPTMVDGLSYWMITSSDRFFIAFFLGVAFVGYYVPAYSIGSLLAFFIFPMAFMLSTMLPKLFDENNVHEVKNYLSYSLKYLLCLMIPAIFGLSAVSRQLLTFFSTQEIADRAFFVVPFVAVSILFYGVIYFFAQILALAKKTKITALVWLVSAFLNLVLNIIFIPMLGILGAAIATLAAYLCALVLMRRFAFKELRFKIDWYFIGKVLMASIFMGISIAWLNLPGASGLIVEILLGVVIYIMLMVLFKGIDAKEINFLKKLLTRESHIS
ncbi:MAG: polysaccharide biosynthesis C-terminal domain-containing protein [bacterium]|nr:polysaccharide biosynthesis C-terminal domain-containing protein [bacterium]